MKTFSVRGYRTEYFKFDVEAENKEEALEKAYGIVACEGVPENAKIFEGEHDTVLAAEKE